MYFPVVLHRLRQHLQSLDGLILNEVETDRLMASQRLSLLRLWIKTEDFDNCKITVASEIDCENTPCAH